MIKEIWDENAFKNGAPGVNDFDKTWMIKYWPFSFDIDGSWAVQDDYRERSGTYYWEFRIIDSENIMATHVGASQSENSFVFPRGDDDLSDKNNVIIDMALVHEWSHYLLNLPDEYTQDVHGTNQRIKDFTFGTGNFCVPDMSNYLAYLMQDNIKTKARDYFTSDNPRRWSSPNEIPADVEIDITYQVLKPADYHIEVREVTSLDDTYRGRKSVSEEAQISQTNSIKLDFGTFTGKRNCWLITMANKKVTREVFLPVAAFNMSKISGLESVRYDLIFSGFEDFNKTKQEVRLIDDADIDQSLHNYKNTNYYAKMKVTGTNTWFVWFLID